MATESVTDTVPALLRGCEDREKICPPLLYDDTDMYLDGVQAIADVLACCDLGGCADSTLAYLAFLQSELIRAARAVDRVQHPRGPIIAAVA